MLGNELYHFTSGHQICASALHTEPSHPSNNTGLADHLERVSCAPVREEDKESVWKCVGGRDQGV